MRRSALLGLALPAIFALSCGLPSADHADVAQPSPAVESGPPTVKPAAPPARNARAEGLAAYLADQPTGLTRSEIDELSRVILEEVGRHDLDLRLILALMYVESRFQPFAVSPVGAMGLMQVLPATGEEVAGQLGIAWHGPETLFDPLANVRIGIAYVKHLTSRYDRISTAIAAYNWGPGNIDRFLRRGAPLPKVYPGLVMDAYARAELTRGV